jgi:uncharacterized protein YjbI with pentapeptide repeats
MFHRKARLGGLSARVGLGITCGGLVVAGGWLTATAEAATVTCPTVSATGVVTPAPVSGVDWAGCSLVGADLAGVYLTNANFSSANLTGANLTNASLYSDNLSGTNLAAATLTHLFSGGITGTPAVFPANWSLLAGHLLGPEAEILRADLANVNLSGRDLAGVVLSGDNLSGADLSGTDLSGAQLDSSQLTGVNISGADLSGGNLGGASSGAVTTSPATSLPANWTALDGYLIGPSANLTGADLAGLNLSGADLKDSVLTNAIIAGTALAQADITGIQTGGLTGSPLSLPPNFIITSNGFVVGPGADLTNALLSGFDLAGDDLAGANLWLATLKGTDLADADLSGANLLNANLTGASLVAADVAGSDFSFVTLTSADLSQTDFSSVDLTAVLSGKITGSPAALPANWQVLDGYLVGPGADLKQASLPGVNLAGADLDGTIFAIANLTSANLTGANLSNGSVGNANLTGARLDNANLNDTSAEGTNLTNASLAGISDTLANFANDTWLNTTCPDGSNSNAYDDGCFSPLDTKPPAVSVTGVANGKVYVTGDVPKAGCRTTDAGTVTKPASVKVTTTGKNGVGRFTAACSGAVDRAGNTQKAPVSVRYIVAYGLHGFIAPGNGATVARSSKTITVRFRLTSANGSPISASVEKSLASAHYARVKLAGPGITAVTVNCGWNAPQGDLTCAIRIPSGVKTGGSQKYTLTAAEGLVGYGFLTVPAVHGTANPEVIHFK